MTTQAKMIIGVLAAAVAILTLALVVSLTSGDDDVRVYGMPGMMQNGNMDQMPGMSGMDGMNGMTSGDMSQMMQTMQDHMAAMAENGCPMASGAGCTQTGTQSGCPFGGTATPTPAPSD